MIGDPQNLPQISAPIADSRGNITPAWLYLLQSLWARTGGSENVVGQGIFSGDVRAFAGPIAKIPGGWLPCDGRPVSRTKYTALFRAIGTIWGPGDGSTTFNLPNAQDSFLIGAGNSYPIGTTGGANQVTLAVGNLPAHNHGVTDPQHTHTFTGTPHTHAITDTGHTHTDGTPNPTADVAAGTDKKSAIAGTTGNSTTGIVIQSATAGGTNAASATNITIQNTGSGTAFPILPPFAAMNFIIKT